MEKARMIIMKGAQAEVAQTVIVARHIEGITLNPLEYLLDEKGEEMKFKSVQEAKAFLLSAGFVEDDMEDFHFINDEEENSL
jgi:pyruvate kinase